MRTWLAWVLIYRRWHERVGNQELRLKLDSE